MYHELLKAHFLKNIDLTPHELDTIVSYYKERKVSKKEYILRAGEICRFEGYVVEGCFKVYVIDPKGNEKVLHFAAKDWWVVDLSSFANFSTADLNIQALEDSTLLVISREDKDLLYRKVPKAERLFRIMYQKAVTAWQRRLIRNHTMNADERYHHFVTTYPQITASVTNKLISSYLGITQEFLSMIRKKRAEKRN